MTEKILGFKIRYDLERWKTKDLMEISCEMNMMSVVFCGGSLLACEGCQ